jgi:hypothetical protein
MNAGTFAQKKKRYWAITSPTNLYSQTLMPSLDYPLKIAGWNYYLSNLVTGQNWSKSALSLYPLRKLTG